jgi:hypothetical protein
MDEVHCEVSICAAKLHKKARSNVTEGANLLWCSVSNCGAAQWDLRKWGSFSADEAFLPKNK